MFHLLSTQVFRIQCKFLGQALYIQICSTLTYSTKRVSQKNKNKKQTVDQCEQVHRVYFSFKFIQSKMILYFSKELHVQAMKTSLRFFFVYASEKKIT